MLVERIFFLLHLTDLLVIGCRQALNLVNVLAIGCFEVEYVLITRDYCTLSLLKAI